MASTGFKSLRGRGLVQLRVDALGHLSRDLQRDDVRAKGRVSREMRALAPVVTRIFQVAAPEDTGRLKRSISAKVNARGRFQSIQISGGALREGFNYLPTTRYGHNKAFISAKVGKKLKVHYLGRRHPTVFALAGRVRGYRPTHDWVEVGWVEAETLLNAAESRMGRTFMHAYAKGIV